MDFDDGHCPSWSNNIRGWANIQRFVTGELGPSVPYLASAPVLMLRPRAWNMTEHNVLLGGKVSPAPLVDFGLLIHHNWRQMLRAGVGPYFYLRSGILNILTELYFKIFLVN